MQSSPRGDAKETANTNSILFPTVLIIAEEIEQ